MSKKFKLSKALFGHSLDVRCVRVTPDDSIISGSRDKTAKLWIHNKPFGSYNEAMTYRDQKNFVVSVLYLEANQDFPDGVIVTGGNDHTIYLYKPAEPFATKTLKIHTNTVSCLSKGLEKGTFLSGSWDCTARLWNLNNPQNSMVEFKGHAAAIWDVMQLSDSRIVTASADKTIIIWSSIGDKLTTLTGHTDCVRGLADMPQSQQFVSVANDASIRLWSYTGDNLQTFYGHTNYIYSIAILPISTSAFVTSDEDRTVRVWENGINTDTIQLPAQSVWSVACLSNGDIVTGSSDGVVRIFTRDQDRYADEATMKKFEEDVENLTRQSMQEIGGYKVSDLPGKEALFDPGKKPGQMKMVREDNKVVAYTWIEDGINNHWEKVGDVLGSTDKTQSDKTMYEGKPYDFVFSVDVEDGKPPLKLPYNLNDDPYKAANEFLTKNMLPSAYLEQVVDFILKNSKQQSIPISNDYVDPFTGASRYTPNTNQTQQTTITNLDPFTGDSSYTTVPTTNRVKYFPITGYRTFDTGDVSVILKKLKEFRAKSDSEISEKQLDDLVQICNGPPVDPYSFDVLFKLLEWPDEFVFPVVDVIRIAVRHQQNNEVIVAANNGILIQKLLYFINDESRFPNNIIVALRTLSNLFCHEAGEHLVYEHRFDIVENLTTLRTLNKNGQTALATLLLNLTVATIKRHDDLGSSVLADVLPDMITKLTESEPQFRAFVALGTLLTSSFVDEVRSKVKQNLGFLKVLETTINSMNMENKNRDCAKELQNCLNQIK